MDYSKFVNDVYDFRWWDEDNEDNIEKIIKHVSDNKYYNILIQKRFDLTKLQDRISPRLIYTFIVIYSILVLPLILFWVYLETNDDLDFFVDLIIVGPIVAAILLMIFSIAFFYYNFMVLKPAKRKLEFDLFDDLLNFQNDFFNKEFWWFSFDKKKWDFPMDSNFKKLIKNQWNFISLSSYDNADLCVKIDYQKKDEPFKITSLNYYKSKSTTSSKYMLQKIQFDNELEFLDDILLTHNSNSIRYRTSEKFDKIEDYYDIQASSEDTVTRFINSNLANSIKHLTDNTPFRLSFYIKDNKIYIIAYVDDLYRINRKWDFRIIYVNISLLVYFKQLINFSKKIM